MLNLDEPWNCRNCVKRGLQKKRNCGGLFRDEKHIDEASTPFDIVFSGFHALASMSFKGVWLDRCPLNFSFASSGGFAPDFVRLFKLAGRYKHQGVLPYGGGLLDQPAKLMDSLDVIIIEQERIDSSKRSIEQARRKTEAAFKGSKRHG